MSSVNTQALTASVSTTVYESEEHNKPSKFQKFLDGNQYTETGIVHYEGIFGEGYVSTGGEETTKEFVEIMNLKSGERVLDVGCGIGGGDFYMAREKGVHVTGVDLSTNMLNRAKKNCPKELEGQLTFLLADINEHEFDPESFEVMYSRDAFLHIEDKVAAFKKMLNWLRPGGRLLISDYCQGEKLSDKFIEYRTQRGYQLTTPEKYGKMLEEAGFINVKVEDRSEQFIAVLKRELNELKSKKDEYIATHGADAYNKIVNGWEAKVQRCTNGEHRWGLFTAEKA